MALRPIAPGLRTIHNGSNDFAKTSLSVPAGDELTVSDYVADQLLGHRVGFKDGPAPIAEEAATSAPAAKKAASKSPRVARKAK